jgi:UDP-glucose 4-epimerase
VRVVVTGASGNAGSGLLRALRRSGSHEVVGMCRRPPPRSPPFDIAAWHDLDLTAPEAERRLGEVFAGAYAVVHLAWAIQPVRDPQRLHRVNIGGLRAVLHATDRVRVPHLVHCSSIAAYAARKAEAEPVGEDWATSGIPARAPSPPATPHPGKPWSPPRFPKRTDTGDAAERRVRTRLAGITTPAPATGNS